MHAAAEAVTAGRGGIAAAARATKVARSTIGRGLKDPRDPASLSGRIRRKGAGRPPVTAHDPTLLDDLERLLEPATIWCWRRCLRECVTRKIELDGRHGRRRSKAGRGRRRAEQPAERVSQLWQRRGVFTVTFATAFVLVVCLLFVLPVGYVASGSVIVGDREPLMGSSSAAWVQKIGDPADMESNILLIRSPRLIRTLLAEPGMSDAVEADCEAVSRQLLTRLRPIDCSRLSGNPEAQLLWVQDRFGVGAVGRSRVISIGYKSPVPEVAPIMVNDLIKAFLDDERGKMLRSRDEAIGWVRQRLQQVDAEIQHDEASIEDFRNRHGLVRGVSGTLTAERLRQAAQHLSEAKGAEAEATLRVQEATGGASSRQAFDSRSIADLKQQLVQARAQLASASQRLGPMNPELISARRLAADLSGQLAAETARVVDSARRNLEATRARVANAQRELDRRSDAASQAADAETQIAAMVRELDIKRGTFVDMSQRLSQLETERRIIEPSTQLVSLAELPTRPAFPQRAPFLVGGLALASVLATAAGLLTAHDGTARVGEQL